MAISYQTSYEHGDSVVNGVEPCAYAGIIAALTHNARHEPRARLFLDVRSFRNADASVHATTKGSMSWSSVQAIWARVLPSAQWSMRQPPELPSRSVTDVA
jgi:hypothetical protein